ncbi:hypothetical protein [Brevundimonas subvibrioides]|uniref:hypothetical protein n=1 Tax=Brevundimonas subvibrioides TaxID=74313 RepID=UPI0032D57554
MTFAHACIAVAALSLANARVSQDPVRSTSAAANGTVVDVITIPRADRRLFYSPVVEGESTDFYASRQDDEAGKGRLQLMGTSYYWGDVRHYHQATFADGSPADFTLGPVEVRQCDGEVDGKPYCMWSEDFTIAIDPEALSLHSRNGVLEFEIVGGRVPESADLSIPVSHIEAVVEVADAL